MSMHKLNSFEPLEEMLEWAFLTHPKKIDLDIVRGAVKDWTQLMMQKTDGRGNRKGISFDNMELIRTNLIVSILCLVNSGQLDEMEEALRANEAMGRELRAAQYDLALVESCQVCGWYNGHSCQASKEHRNSGKCFAWRGAEKARLWQEV